MLLYLRGSDKGNEHVDSVQAKARSGLPQLRDAVHRKTSLTSLAVHLYCRICAQQENEKQAAPRILKKIGDG
jgi:hypothetical protein